MGDVRDIVVRFLGEPHQLMAAAGEAEGSVSKFGLMAKAVAAGSLIALAEGSHKCIEAAEKQKISQESLTTAMHASGQSYEEQRGHIESTIGSQVKLAGYTDNELRASFTKLFRTTGDTSKALGDMKLATDLARGGHVSLESATRAVLMAEENRVLGLRRYGVSVDTVKTAQNALRAEMATYTAAHGPLDAAEKAHFAVLMDEAKAADKTTMAQNGLTLAAQKYAGAAEAATTPSQRFHASLNTLEETIGTKLLPAFETMMGVLVGGIQWMSDHATVVEILAAAIGVLSAGFLAASITAWALNSALLANPVALVIVGIVALGAALVVAYEKCGTFRKIVDEAFTVVKTVAQALVAYYVGPLINTIEKVVDVGRTLASFLSGALVGAWNAVRTAASAVGTFFGTTLPHYVDVVRGALSGLAGALTGMVTGAFNTARGAVSALGTMLSGALHSALDGAEKIGKTVADFFKGAFTAALNAVRGPIDAVAGAIRGITSAIDAIGGAVSSALGWLDRLSSAAGKIGSVLGHIPHAEGGPVFPGLTYLVGEKGPELFVSDQPGYIIPNGDFATGGSPTILGSTGGGGGNTYVQQDFHVAGSVVTERQLIDLVRSALLQIQRANRTTGLVAGA